MEFLIINLFIVCIFLGIVVCFKSYIISTYKKDKEDYEAYIKHLKKEIAVCEKHIDSCHKRLDLYKRKFKDNDYNEMEEN